MPPDFDKFPELTNNQMELYYFDSPHQQISENFSARVNDVIDGDTINVRVDFRDFKFPIRIAEIAAPELNEVDGEQSKSWLESQIDRQTVEVEIDPNNRVEKWGRLLGKIIIGGIDIGEESVNQGFSVRFEERIEGTIPDFDKELDNL